MLLEERRTQREVALAVGVAAPAVRKSYRKITAEADVEITV